jgi:hypothetical protein
MMRRVFTLLVILLGLATPQVYCGYESLVTMVRPLNATGRCFTTTDEHPSSFDECPLPPFPILDIDHWEAKTEVRFNAYSSILSRAHSAAALYPSSSRQNMN